MRRQPGGGMTATEKIPSHTTPGRESLQGEGRSVDKAFTVISQEMKGEAAPTGSDSSTFHKLGQWGPGTISPAVHFEDLW